MIEFTVEKVTGEYAGEIQMILKKLGIIKTLRYLVREKCLIAIDNGKIVAFAEKIRNEKKSNDVIMIHFDKRSGKKKKSRIKVAFLEAIAQKKFWQQKTLPKNQESYKQKSQQYMFPG